jgi:hypothetical protein
LVKKPSIPDSTVHKKQITTGGKIINKSKSYKEKYIRSSNTKSGHPYLAVEGKRVEIDLLKTSDAAVELKIAPDVKIVSCMKKDTMMRNEPKTVTFAEKLIVNEDSLDISMIERIKHNMEYNDDRIFEGLSIFEHEDEDEESKIEKSPINQERQSDEKADEGRNGDSGNKDFTDIEQNQGILSS